jgi:putative ATP-dependent endonuclease of OLD family
MADLVLQDVKAKHRFRSTPIIAIDGVDFEPYVRLLLTQYGGVCIADRLVVVTDGDPAAPGDRVAALNELGVSLGTTGVLTVKHAFITLEASLMEAGNDACLRAAFLDQRPTLEADWIAQVEGVPAADRPNAVVELIAAKRLRKGDLAQAVAAWSTVPQHELVVPQYLRETIDAVAAP